MSATKQTTEQQWYPTAEELDELERKSREAIQRRIDTGENMVWVEALDLDEMDCP